MSHEFQDLGFGDVNFSFDQQRAPHFVKDELPADRDVTLVFDETMTYPALRKAMSGAGGLDIRV